MGEEGGGEGWGKVVRPEKITAHTRGQHMPMSALCYRAKIYCVNLKQMIINSVGGTEIISWTT